MTRRARGHSAIPRRGPIIRSIVRSVIRFAAAALVLSATLFSLAGAMPTGAGGVPPSPLAAPAPKIAPAPEAARTPAGFRLVYQDDSALFYAPSQAAAIEISGSSSFHQLADTARATVSRVSRDLAVPGGPALRIFLVPARAMNQGNISLPALPSWAAGAAFGETGEIVLIVGRPGAYPDRDLPGVLAHECAHVVLGRALSRRGQRAPRWFEEGFAVLEARPWGWADALALATVVLPSSPPALSDMDAGFRSGESEAREAYSVSVSFMAFLEKRSGPDAARRIVREMSDGAGFDQAFRTVTGASVGRIESEWRRGIQIRYRWIPLITSSGALWTGILVLLFFAGARRRARRREMERIWERSGDTC